MTAKRKPKKPKRIHTRYVWANVHQSGVLAVVYWDAPSASIRQLQDWIGQVVEWMEAQEK